jgi:hypothetical protein
MERTGFKSGELWLEGRITRPQGQGPFPAAVIAHPHPLFGGSMDNNVVYALRDTLIASGYVALRFNFRGVGKSSGQYSELAGEPEDVMAAVEHLKTEDGVDPKKIIVCGYSFGGLAVLYAIAKGLNPTALVLVSPMLPEAGLSRDPVLQKIIPLKVPALILAGGRDQFFRPMLYEPLIPTGSKTSKIVLNLSADHLWLGEEREIIRQVREFLATI